MIAWSERAATLSTLQALRAEVVRVENAVQAGMLIPEYSEFCRALERVRVATLDHQQGTRRG